jgi:hypothetical protein
VLALQLGLLVCFVWWLLLGVGVGCNLGARGAGGVGGGGGKGGGDEGGLPISPVRSALLSALAHARGVAGNPFVLVYERGLCYQRNP